jgi:RNA polymerase sigma-70 factor (ECF subfamily)
LSTSGQTLSDEELIVLCRNNQVFAQNELYKRFARRVMGIAMRYSRNREDAQDIVQDSFVKIFLGLKNFKGDGSFEGWIKRIAVNTAINHIQKQLKFTNESAIEAASDLIYDNQIIKNISANELIGLVQAMPDGFRTVFNLFVIEGYQHQEIGEMLGISEGTSKSQLARARQHLANKIKSKKLDYNE